jgi:hypothetical protein
LVAAAVVTIAVHAYVTRKEARNHLPLTIAVSGEASRFEPLARLVSRRTSRVTTVQPSPPAELFVMPSMTFVRRREGAALKGLFGIWVAEGDRAVIVAATGRREPPQRLGDILFTAPESINGCWAQVRALGIQASPDSMRFAPGGDPSRVVWAVESGEVAYGACRASDLRRSGVVLDVVLETPALPEWIVAARAADASYFTARLGDLGASFANPSSVPAERYLVELLAERGLGTFHPLSPAHLARLEGVVDVSRRVSSAQQVGSAGSP